MYVLKHKGKIVAQNFSTKFQAERYKKKYFYGYADTKLKDLKVVKVVSNPQKAVVGKFIPCKAVRINKNGSVSIKK